MRTRLTIMNMTQSQFRELNDLSTQKLIMGTTWTPKGNISQREALANPEREVDILWDTTRVLSQESSHLVNPNDLVWEEGQVDEIPNAEALPFSWNNQILADVSFAIDNSSKDAPPSVPPPPPPDCFPQDAALRPVLRLVRASNAWSTSFVPADRELLRNSHKLTPPMFDLQPSDWDSKSTTGGVWTNHPESLNSFREETPSVVRLASPSPILSTVENGRDNRKRKRNLGPENSSAATERSFSVPMFINDHSCGIVRRYQRCPVDTPGSEGSGNLEPEVVIDVESATSPFRNADSSSNCHEIDCSNLPSLETKRLPLTTDHSISIKRTIQQWAQQSPSAFLEIVTRPFNYHALADVESQGVSRLESDVFGCRNVWPDGMVAHFTRFDLGRISARTRSLVSVLLSNALSPQRRTIQVFERFSIALGDAVDVLAYHWDTGIATFVMENLNPSGALCVVRKFSQCVSKLEESEAFRTRGLLVPGCPFCGALRTVSVRQHSCHIQLTCTLCESISYGHTVIEAATNGLDLLMPGGPPMHVCDPVAGRPPSEIQQKQWQRCMPLLICVLACFGPHVDYAANRVSPEAPSCPRCGIGRLTCMQPDLYSAPKLGCPWCGVGETTEKKPARNQQREDRLNKLRKISNRIM
eukprot:Gregarina_sp_Poly_1__5449@NODE_287_length_10022_cov_246_780311_g248_i0_p2_GENE_NODE_287_length_10022_cov_246_780311_g248_i0NODE_287_length_10022_cov_246_780311_g248_i0_p2_ORF_typecomplete_len642_score77_16TerY_C/PF15616_6/8TerY_C/PF15616_6/4_6zfribbon_3/PF13248_6/16zfribbon_3/PF13248_6/9_9zfribbon_3/PF13248_6/5_1e02Elf1/PF05129_13/2_2e03Elf1/PF05129_13/0_67Elf1/PF05129_13/2_3e03_NODE_287_length_10022_cov_246_780311_g248_i01972122